MSQIPHTPLTLHGGCFCRAVRYKVSIPPFSERGEIPMAVPVPPSTDTVRFPVIGVDHCTSCRLSMGALFQTWLVMPNDWVEFSLAPRPKNGVERGEGEGDDDDGCGKITFNDYERVTPPVLDIVKPTKDIRKTTYLGYYRSNPSIHRTHCSRCGTTLTYHYSGAFPPQYSMLPPMIDLTMGSLDKGSLEMEGVRPDRHGWWTDSVPWVAELLRNGDGGRWLRHPAGAFGGVVNEGYGGGADGKDGREAEGTFWEDAVKGIHSKTEDVINTTES